MPNNTRVENIVKQVLLLSRESQDKAGEVFRQGFAADRPVISVVREYSDKMRAAVSAELETAINESRGTCGWTAIDNEIETFWETDCGGAFTFEVDGPVENKMKFCCYCGGELSPLILLDDPEGENL